MQWNRGAIHEAIGAAKAQKKIFLVYIEGTDDASKTMTEMFNSSTIAEALADDCVPIKLEANSVEYRQFHQIYPVLMVPSTFFIGTTGVPLDVAAGALEQNTFLAKIQNAKVLHQQALSSSTVGVASNPASNSTNQTDVNVGNSESPIQPGPSHSAEPSTLSTPTQSLEERVERAKQLLEEKKLQRMKEEEESDKQKEMEYRKTGKEMQKAKAMREQKEMEEWAKSRKKEKEEERIARERVRQQIAQDRAERAAQSFVEPKKLDEPSRPVPGPSEFHGKCVRIQLRFPDGSSTTKEFPVTATLRDVHTYVVQDVKPAFSRFSLATSFPRRQFQQSDYSQTLVDLGLAPSAVLLLMPEKSVAISGPRGQAMWSLVSMILSPVTALWMYVMSFFQRKPDSSNAPNNSRSRNEESRENSSSSGPAEQAARRRLNASGTAPYRREGNIHRFANDGADTDDENNTWNGNSTQQL